MIYFPETIIQWSTTLVIDMLHHCRPMHNDTYSVHNHPLKPWWGHLPCSQTFCYVFPPPLSGLNWCLLSSVGGQGPPTPKVASPLLGSPQTPFPGSRTANTSSLFLTVGYFADPFSLLNRRFWICGIINEIAKHPTPLHSTPYWRISRASTVN
jgi:hypothetical protein